jgi:hypothetical protein
MIQWETVDGFRSLPARNMKDKRTIQFSECDFFTTEVQKHHHGHLALAPWKDSGLLREGKSS